MRHSGGVHGSIDLATATARHLCDRFAARWIDDVDALVSEDGLTVDDRRTGNCGHADDRGQAKAM